MAMTLIWSAMVVASLICGGMNGSLNAVSQAAAEGAQSAVTLCLSMAGMLCLWNGVLEVMNRSGLTPFCAAFASRSAPDLSGFSGQCPGDGRGEAPMCAPICWGWVMRPHPSDCGRPGDGGAQRRRCK